MTADPPKQLQAPRLTLMTRARLEALRPKEREQFFELLVDAASELQRELLERALLAGRAVADLHAFADEMRPLDDLSLFRACFGQDSRAAGLAAPEAFAQRLALEADPMACFAERKRALSPPPREGVEEPTLPAGALESGMGRPARAVEVFVNAETEPLGVSYEARDVDRADFTLEAALELVARALSQGRLVPVVLGSEPGDSAGFALLLQVHKTGPKRVFQLHDPVTGQHAWVAERELLQRQELPGMPHEKRRVTAVLLPGPTRGSD